MRALLLVLLAAACGSSSTDNRDDYLRKSKQIEARLKLKALARAARDVVADTNALPTGSAGPSPATACCTQPDKQCPANAADWSAPVWQQLDMYADAPTRFQYAYSSDGKTFTASATGDVNCDGKPVTFTITGNVSGNELIVDTSQVDDMKKK